MVNRNKSDISPARHKGKCSVCKHPHLSEIEALYLNFIPLPKIGEDFALSQQALLRHAQFAGLDQARVADTEAALKSIIARGFQQVTKIDGRLLIDAIKELNKITGKHQTARENDADRERKRQQYERAVQQFIGAKAAEGESCSRARAIAALAELEPEVSVYLN
jgi:hypothetical protein